MELNNKKTINGWAMYDWANSVYSLVITSTIFPIYYATVTKDAFNGSIVRFFGAKITNTVLYSYSLSFSFLVLAILLPLLSGIADYSGNKKGFMKFFAYLGSASCAALFFFAGKNVEYGIACSVMASIGFGGSLVFYNAYLPEIATPDRYDSVSARGYAMGYIGSVILMIVNLMMVEHKEWFGFGSIADGTLPSRVVFVTVGIWWFGFSQITFARLPKGITRSRESHVIAKGFKELSRVWKSLRDMPMTRNFLISFFFYDMGVQTIMYLAATYGSDRLGLPSGVLITTILLIQLVAIGGAYLFAWVSKKKGNIFSITTMLIIWTIVCSSIFFVNSPSNTDISVKVKELLKSRRYEPVLNPKDLEAFNKAIVEEAKNDLQKNVAYQFEAIGFIVGMVMGGIQSLSRATYSKLLPETEDHASYFSFYDVCEKIAIVLGTALFGFVQQQSGDMRNSVWPLLAAFIIGLIVLQKVKLGKRQVELNN